MGFKFPELPDCSRLIAIAEQQIPRLVDAIVARSEIEYRKATALERIADALQHK